MPGRRWNAGASYARKVGLGDLHLVIVYSFSEQRTADFYGFDAAVQFPPHLQATPVTPRIPGRSPDFTGFIYDYTEVRRYALEQFASASAQTKLYPGVMPSWDNTARQRTRSTIWVNSSPEAYYEWLAEASRLVRAKSSQSDSLVFINAWNEWAEGCHLEPDERYGYAWLNATSLALRPGRDRRTEIRWSRFAPYCSARSPCPRPALVRCGEAGRLGAVLSSRRYPDGIRYQAPASTETCG